MTDLSIGEMRSKYIARKRSRKNILSNDQRIGKVTSRQMKRGEMQIRGAITVFLGKVIRDAIAHAKREKRQKVTSTDLVYALKSYEPVLNK